MSDPQDRARSIAATVAIHIALGAALLTGLALKADRHADDGLKTFDVVPPPPPPPPEPIIEPPSKMPDEQPAPAGKKAEPSPIVAPPARLPTPQQVAAAPVAGSGSDGNAGAAASGSGTGAGGTGNGSGGGGRGAGLGNDAQLLGGFRGRVSRQLLQPFAASNGYAHLVLTIGETGRVTACNVLQSSGSAAVDGAFCQIMIGQSRWTPARDTLGRPVSVQKRWTATWRK